MNRTDEPSRRELLHAAAFGAVAAGGGLAVAADEKPRPPGALPQVKPQEIGIDAKRLQVAYDLMREWTAGKKAMVPGGAILVGRSAKALAPRHFGKQGAEADAEALRRDAGPGVAARAGGITLAAGTIVVVRFSTGGSPSVSLAVGGNSIRPTTEHSVRGVVHLVRSRSLTFSASIHSWIFRSC
jgi:hypothetical protein